MNEDYVSHEVAKLLKEKGFNWYCRAYYTPGSKVLSHSHDVSNTCNVDIYAAPTLYMAQKWLREVKESHIMIDVCASGYYAVLWKTNGTFIKTLSEKGPNDGGVWDSYEGALDAAIESALHFI